MLQKSIIITGAMGAIGQALCKYFTAQGHHVAAIDIHDNIDHLAQHPCLTYFKADLTNETQNKTVIDQIFAAFKSIDALINNAGISKSGMSWKLSLADWQTSFDINITTAFLTTKHCLPHFREAQHGRIINMSSILASTGFPGASAYSASKAALEGFTKSLSKELASHHITINNIAPGYIDGGMLYDIPEDIRTQIKQNIPMQRFGTTQDICALAGFLISDDASYITGQTIGVNGGL